MSTEMIYDVETSRPVPGADMDRLVDVADELISALTTNRRLVAFGPVVTVAATGDAVRVVYSVQAGSAAEAQQKSAAVLATIDQVVSSISRDSTTTVGPAKECVAA